MISSLSLSPFLTPRCAGHDTIWNRLLSDLKEASLSHAMLFVGLEHVGKTTLALDLAVQIQLHGLSDVDQAFRAEKLLRQGLDPDTILLLKTSTDTETLPIETVRQLLRRLSEAKQGEALIVIVEDLGRLSPEAMNLLLKPLEEPNPQVFFILTARSEADILATIRSRTRLFRFTAVSDEVLQSLGNRFLHDFLDSQREAMALGEVIQTPPLEVACRLSTGRPGLLHRLLHDETHLKLLLQIENDLDAFFMRPSRSALFELLKTYEDRALTEPLLDRALVLARRWLLQPLDCPASLPGLAGPEHKVNWCRAVLDAQADLEANVNARLTLERLFLSIF